MECVPAPASLSCWVGRFLPVQTEEAIAFGAEGSRHLVVRRVHTGSKPLHPACLDGLTALQSCWQTFGAFARLHREMPANVHEK